MIDDHWLKNEFKGMTDIDLLREMEFAEMFGQDTNLKIYRAEMERREREQANE